MGGVARSVGPLACGEDAQDGSSSRRSSQGVGRGPGNSAGGPRDGGVAEHGATLPGAFRAGTGREGAAWAAGVGEGRPPYRRDPLRGAALDGRKATADGYADSRDPRGRRVRSRGDGGEGGR